MMSPAPISLELCRHLIEPIPAYYTLVTLIDMSTLSFLS